MNPFIPRGIPISMLGIPLSLGGIPITLVGPTGHQSASKLGLCMNNKDKYIQRKKYK